ncbi:hypothetical protein ACIBI9_23990 [Nonomuraea sp. NPDC050451]|uniref:hypothetical protein n=1 Tax=Nonomuraea sp. NPDC050451 TaxID=3364364 RepID=UPI0037A259AE
MLTRLTVTATALLALAALSGCGSATESAAPSPSSTAEGKEVQIEAAKADCMKQKGFKYVAYVTPHKPGTEDDKRRASGNYQAMRKFREKYGFGVFAQHVYPKEMGSAPTSPDSEPNPNMKIQNALSKTQMQAYRKALDACQVSAANQVLGLKLKSTEDFYDAQFKASVRARKGKLNTDPELVELAAAMATCLKGKGYTVGDTTPVTMSELGQKTWLGKEDKLGREQMDDVPDAAPPAKDDKVPMYYAPTLTPEQARPYLAKEIRAALDDLECGKDFYPAFLPKEQAVQGQVSAEFGM